MNINVTPGPWTANEFREVIAPNGYVVARVMGPSPWARGKEWHEENAVCLANSAAISAIPEMLDALSRAGQSAGFQYMTAETRDAINAAIAKATAAALPA